VNKTAIIGVGSPFGDDAIAYHVIECLKEESLPAIDLHYYDRPGWHLLEYMKPFNTVHLVDAIVSGSPPGTLHRYEDIHTFQQHQNLLSSHSFGLAETLLLGEVLGELPAQLIIHGIEISLDSDPLEYLSLVAQIKQEILNAI